MVAAILEDNLCPLGVQPILPYKMYMSSKRMPSSLTFQKFGPVAPRLHNIVFGEVI